MRLIVPLALALTLAFATPARAEPEPALAAALSGGVPAALVAYGFATGNWQLMLGGPATTGLGHYVLGHPVRGLGFGLGAYAVPLGAGFVEYTLADAAPNVGSLDALGPGLAVGVAAGMLMFAWAAGDAYQLAEQARRERLQRGEL